MKAPAPTRRDRLRAMLAEPRKGHFGWQSCRNLVERGCDK